MKWKKLQKSLKNLYDESTAEIASKSDVEKILFVNIVMQLSQVGLMQSQLKRDYNRALDLDLRVLFRI